MANCVSETEADDAEQEKTGGKAQHGSQAECELSVIAGSGFQFFLAEVSDHSLPSVSPDSRRRFCVLFLYRFANRWFCRF
jgi:hypothetical protein